MNPTRAEYDEPDLPTAQSDVALNYARLQRATKMGSVKDPWSSRSVDLDPERADVAITYVRLKQVLSLVAACPRGQTGMLPGISAPELDKGSPSPIGYFHCDNYCCEPDGGSPVG